MAKDDLAAIEFGPMDLRTLEEISTQLGACKLASEQKTGPKQSAGAQVLSVLVHGRREVDELPEGDPGADENQGRLTTERARRQVRTVVEP